ncbi:uncharacterized protein J3D65DRAFT_130513 [Phyllosticta citribraziliensis]|uniref:Uncharacterized protein n=1 Tax=Phyllosticta citribraziliensis TaxID=989973 RepID=A0ABR1L7D5_9PEZI
MADGLANFLLFTFALGHVVFLLVFWFRRTFIGLDGMDGRCSDSTASQDCMRLGFIILDADGARLGDTAAPCMYCTCPGVYCAGKSKEKRTDTNVDIYCAQSYMRVFEVRVWVGSRLYYVWC